MADEKLAKRADTPKVEGKWKRGRPKLRLGIALKVTRRQNGRRMGGGGGVIEGTGDCWQRT